MLVANRSWNGSKMTNYAPLLASLAFSHQKTTTITVVRSLPVLNYTHLSVVFKLKHAHPIFSLPTVENLAILPPQTAVIPPRDWPAAVITHAEPRARRALTFDVARHLWVTRRRSLPSEGISEAPAAILRGCFFSYLRSTSYYSRRHLKMEETSGCLVRLPTKDTWVTDVQLGTTFYNPCKSRSIISTLVCAAAPTYEMEVTSQHCTKMQNVHAASAFLLN